MNRSGDPKDVVSFQIAKEKEKVYIVLLLNVVLKNYPRNYNKLSFVRIRLCLIFMNFERDKELVL